MSRGGKILLAVVCGFVGIYFLVFQSSYLLLVKPSIDLHRANMAKAVEQHRRDALVPNQWSRELCSNCGTRDVGPLWNRVRGTLQASGTGAADDIDWEALGLRAKDAAAIIAAQTTWPALRGSGGVKIVKSRLIDELSPTAYWELPKSRDATQYPATIRAKTLMTVAKGRIVAAATDFDLRKAFADARALASLASSTQTRLGTMLAIKLLALERVFREQQGQALAASRKGKVLTQDDEARLARIVDFRFYAMNPLTEAVLREKAMHSEDDFAYCGALIQQMESAAAIGWIAASTYSESYRAFDRVLATSKACRFGRVKGFWKAQGQTLGDPELQHSVSRLKWVPMLVPTMAKVLMALTACGESCAASIAPGQVAH